MGGKWIALAGVRWDNFKDIDKSDQSEFDDFHLTPRLALVYPSTPSTSWYGNYSESFNPKTISTQEAELDFVYKPETGKMVEIGVKSKLFGDKILSTLAIYQISGVYLFGLRTLGSNYASSQRVLWGKALTKGMGKLRWLSYGILLCYLVVLFYQYLIE